MDFKLYVISIKNGHVLAQIILKNLKTVLTVVIRYTNS